MYPWRRLFSKPINTEAPDKASPVSAFLIEKLMECWPNKVTVHNNMTVTHKNILLMHKI